MRFSAIIGLAILGARVFFVLPAEAQSVAVTTYHYDQRRSGWNSHETALTPANITGPAFGVTAEADLDAQIDAQPLVVPNQAITTGPAPGTYEVVYVATEANTIYAINAANGAVLLSRTLGPPVPHPLFCVNDPPAIGIRSTPVIDLTTRTLYVVAYTLISGAPTFQLFALKLNDLSTKIGPVIVNASHVLSDGTVYNFDARIQQQRPALLEANGIIYVGFGSYCDFESRNSRGWLLGYRASDLASLSANRLNDTLPKADHMFLASIWMSGYGIASDATGAIYFATGNSGPGTYDGVGSIQESVVKVSPLLHTVLGIFTPQNENTLDQFDADLGSGGVMPLPGLYSGPTPNLLIAAGKGSRLFLLNRDNLGGFTPGGPDKSVDSKATGPCWCGPSYFFLDDFGLRVVTSTGSNGNLNIKTWRVQTKPTAALVLEGLAPSVLSGQDQGGFTAVSSNGTKAGTGIIWTVTRPSDPSTFAVNLYAFAAEGLSGKLPLLYSSQAGTWPNVGGNANIVPVVANGRVYIASNKQLTIFGLGGKPFKISIAALAIPASLAERDTHDPPNRITGILEGVEGSLLSLRTRAGNSLRVDDTEAGRAGQIGSLEPANPYTALGTYDQAGVLHALAVARAKNSPALWPPDR